MATEPESPTLSERAAAPPPAQVQELYRLMSGYRVSQALYVMATLGLADLLAAGTQDSDALAQRRGRMRPPCPVFCASWPGSVWRARWPHAASP